MKIMQNRITNKSARRNNVRGQPGRIAARGVEIEGDATHKSVTTLLR